jgi:hypothetical protein
VVDRLTPLEPLELVPDGMLPDGARPIVSLVGPAGFFMVPPSVELDPRLRLLRDVSALLAPELPDAANAAELIARSATMAVDKISFMARPF